MFSNLLAIGSVGSALTKAFKELTFVLDKAVYGLVETVYSVFYYLAEAQLLNPTIVKNFTERMYILLGIAMIFILAFNLLTYIVNPDKMMDKQVGASAFVKDVIIGLAIISLTPMLFTKLYALQSKIITSGVIENLILGGSSGVNSSPDPKYNSLTAYNIAHGAHSMTATIYTAFLYPEDNSYTVLSCNTDAEYDTSNEADSKFHDYCVAYEDAKSGGGVSSFAGFVSDEDFNFTPFLTTIAGIVLLFFMLNFCISLAKRAGKLAIIQLLAPIPVSLEILPNKKGTRKKWIDTLISVYLEVFMYLFTMYIVIFLISLIPSVISSVFGSMSEGSGVAKLIAMVILIFGLLMFGKEVPKLIEDITGLKTTGGLSDAIASGKKALGMAGIGAGVVGGFVGGTVSNMVKNFNAKKGEKGDRHYGSAIMSGLAGGASAGARNLWNARKVHNYHDAMNNMNRITGTVQGKRTDRTAYWNQHGHSIAGVVSGHAEDAWNNFRDDVHAFAHGDYNQSSAEISLYDKFSDKAKGTKVDMDTDAQYQEYRRQFTNAKNQQYYDDFRKYKQQTRNFNATEDDFNQWLMNPANRANPIALRHQDLVSAQNSMDARKAEKISKNESKLRLAAQDVKNIMNDNPQALAWDDGSGNGTFISRINACVDENGELKTGKTAADLQKVMDDFNKYIVKQKANVEIRSAGDRYRDEQRQARRNRNNNNSGGNSH